MRAALTITGLYLARESEDVLRDMIPLYEIVDVRKRRDMPGEDARLRHSNLGAAATENGAAVIATEDGDLFIVQIRTVENGYNSGRTYYFNTRAEDACNEWVQLLRTEADRAMLRKQAGPSLLRKLRYRLLRLYESNTFQYLVAVLIFFSFLVNIVQTEVSGAGSWQDGTVRPAAARPNPPRLAL